MELDTATSRIRAGREPLPILPGVQAHGQMRIALHEVGSDAPDRPRDLDLPEACQRLLPEHAELHLGEPAPHAEVDAEAEGEVLTHIRTVDPELVRTLEDGLVAIRRHVP